MTPFIKWVGGKRQLINQISTRLPKKYNRYIEPFVGGGAVFFKLAHSNSVINDINPVLINSYKQIRDNVYPLIELLEKLDSIYCDKEFYNKIRDKFNDKIKSAEYDLELAALFIYINKKCYNGLFRVNSKGLFNVPFNNKSSGASFDAQNLMEISEFLKDTTIFNGDFQKIFKLAEKDDFIFIDSPYVPLNATTFDSYTKDGFDYESHKRLAKEFKKLDKRGCYLMLTNHDTPLIRELYQEYKIEPIQVRRAVNSDGSNRKGTEVIITNY
ncbi:DNA adenine methylase [Mycoplasma hafezii]|uniref:DNA adenine methylase n=1 Tax=Mycoplasma hafezii TaxID=525886 RepID=UPI003CE6FEE6